MNPSASVAMTLMLLAAAPAAATPVSLIRPEPGYTYFNRPGADIGVHDEAVKACLAFAAHTSQPDRRDVEMAMGGGAIPFLIDSIINSMEERRGLAVNIENCMVARGWRVVRLPQDEGEALSRLDPAALSQRLAAWVGADSPHGEVVRVWGNDALKTETARFGPAGDLDKVSLSRTAAVPSPPKPAGKPPKPPKMPKSARPPEGLTKFNLKPPPPGQAMLIVRLVGGHAQFAQSVTFRRLGADPDTPAWVADGRPDTVTAPLPRGADPHATLQSNFAFFVTPGRWRLESLDLGAYHLDFCLGAPFFDIRPGDIVYAGAFDLQGAELGPDMTLDPVRPIAMNLRKAGDALRPADYANGSVGGCRGAYIYALELKEAPMAPGYVRGVSGDGG